MDEDSTPNIQVYFSPTPWYKRKILWAFLITLLLIPLGFYAYKNYFLVSAPPPVSSPSPPTSPANPLVAKAKALGYDIIRISPEDKNGSTIFYKERPKGEVNFKGVGLVYSQATSSANQKQISYIAGAFIDFQDIGNSPDLYLELINPLTGINLPKVRVILSKDSPFKTYFRVEDLSKDAIEGNLGILSDWSVDRLKKIIQKGDALVLSGLNQTDSNRELITTMLVIRRFNGLLQIEKELQ